MFLGLRTAIYYVTDLKAAKAFYTKVLGKPPCYDEAPYVGYNVGGFELGLLAVPEEEVSSTKKHGVIVYWGVEDIKKQLARVLEIGAREHSPISEVGGGILVATVTDPFGNPFGLIYNTHFPNTQQ